MAPREGNWRRYNRDLDGAWHAIDDLRETLRGPEGFNNLIIQVEELVDAEMIARTVAEQMRKDRTRLLTGARGIFVLGCSAIVAGAAVATAAHTWIH